MVWKFDWVEWFIDLYVVYLFKDKEEMLMLVWVYFFYYKGWYIVVLDLLDEVLGIMSIILYDGWFFKFWFRMFEVWIFCDMYGVWGYFVFFVLDRIFSFRRFIDCLGNGEIVVG